MIAHGQSINLWLILAEPIAKSTLSLRMSRRIAQRTALIYWRRGAVALCGVSWLRLGALLKQAHQLRRDVIDIALDVVLRPLPLAGRGRRGFVLRVGGCGNWLHPHLQRVAEIEKRRSQPRIGSASELVEVTRIGREGNRQTERPIYPDQVGHSKASGHQIERRVLIADLFQTEGFARNQPMA